MFTDLQRLTADELTLVINEIVKSPVRYKTEEIETVLNAAIEKQMDESNIAIMRQLLDNAISSEKIAGVKIDADVLSTTSATSTKTKQAEEAPEKKSIFSTLRLKPIKTEEEIPENRIPEPEAYDDEPEAEPFPILRFLADFYKTLGWLIFAIFLAGFGYVALNFLKDNTTLQIVSFVLFAFVGVIMLIVFYSKAESIQLRLKTEEHLRKLVKQKFS